MADRAKRILNKLLDIWKKYTSKQKTLIISAVCVVILAFALLIVLTQRKQYEELTVADNTKDAGAIVDLLKNEGIAYRVSSDHVTISVEAKSLSDAVFLLAGNDIPSSGISLDDLLNNSLSTTNSDRTLKLNLYFQNQLRNSIIKMTGIDDAQVYYLPAEASTSILTETKDTSASIFLTVNDDFEKKTAKAIAEVVASVIGNQDSDTIKITDQYGNILNGEEEDLSSGSISSTEDYKERIKNTCINDVYRALIKSEDYDDAVIVPNFDFNMNVVEELYNQNLPADGQDQGLLSHSYTYDSQNANSSGGTPGTDSNDETTYQTTDSNSNTGTVKIQENDYAPNTKQTKTIYEVGGIIPENSTIAIVLTKVITNKEEDLQTQGKLQGTTFEQYALANSASTKLTVDPSIYSLVSAATGIAVDKITINAYEKPVFIPKVVTIRSWTDYLQIILAVLIVALLIFVVFKGIRPVEVTELEPELSVEQLLATTKENQSIEDIEFNEVSEVRRMIEKFVDEKPEAVAQLLRNWLNEDWN